MSASGHSEFPKNNLERQGKLSSTNFLSWKSSEHATKPSVVCIQTAIKVLKQGLVELL